MGDMPGLDDSIRRMARREVERAMHHPGDAPPIAIGPLLKNILILATYGTMAFTAGMNWHKVEALRLEFDQHVVDTREAYRTFASREVTNEQYVAIQRQLLELQTSLQRLQDMQSAHQRANGDPK